MKVECELITEDIYNVKDIIEIVSLLYNVKEIPLGIYVDYEIPISIIHINNKTLLSSIINYNEMKIINLFKHIASYTGGMFTPNESQILHKKIELTKFIK
jgi:hypothetical protein